MCIALAKLDNIVWQTLLFAFESSAVDKKVTPNLRRKQQCLASNIGQFRQALSIHQRKSLSKGFLYIIEGHRYADTRQLLSSFMLPSATRINQANDTENCSH